jgi:hypothetical protein
MASVMTWTDAKGRNSKRAGDGTQAWRHGPRPMRSFSDRGNQACCNGPATACPSARRGFGVGGCEVGQKERYPQGMHP